MDKRELNELWEQVMRIWKTENISDDAMLELGNIFKEIQSKVDRLEEYVERIEEESELLYGRLNNIIALAQKEI